MIHRIHVSEVLPGRLELDPGEAHHVRNVLRLFCGDELELFDDAGHSAIATIESRNTRAVIVVVNERDMKLAASSGVSVTIASAVPKGDRADWMIEKLSELGVSRFIPLITARSVVLPAGKNKRERWQRIATESAKQSRRAGVMAIDDLTPLSDAVTGDSSARYFLSTEADAAPIASSFRAAVAVSFFIGPEGGWTDDEIARMKSSEMTAVRLTATVLRVETAAIAAAAIAATR